MSDRNILGLEYLRKTLFEEVPLKRVSRATGIRKRFGDLRVRPKLIVLHNLFFLVLTCAVYFTVIPSLEQRVATAKTIEMSLITEIFAGDRPLQRLPRIDSYDYREGSAEALGVPLEVRQWLDRNPGQVWQKTPASDYLFKYDLRTGRYRRITLPNTVYDEVIHRAKIALFAVLGAVYVLAVIVLELFIMPLYVYQPLSLMLNADRATQAGDRENELILEEFIPGDEIGQIMRSRNLTIKQLRRKEDDLSAALSHLEAQDRLASLGLLSASVAHELNTPLAVLQGSIEKLLEKAPDEQTSERLSRMRKVTGRIQKISESLVDFARVRREEASAVALRPLLDEAWALVAIDERAAGVRFANRVDEGVAVIANPDRLIQVFVNLLRNSLYAAGSGGNIEVRSRAVERDGTRWIVTSVDDDGPGIPPDVLPNVFEAFVSTRLDARGTGLGLTVAEGIVRQHGGSLSASNRPGGGARLEVALRAADQVRASA